MLRFLMHLLQFFGSLETFLVIFVGKLSNNLAVKAVFLAQYIFTQSQAVIFVVVVFFRSDINVQDGKHCNTYDVVTFEAHGDIPR